MLWHIDSQLSFQKWLKLLLDKCPKGSVALATEKSNAFWRRLAELLGDFSRIFTRVHRPVCRK